MIADSVPTYAAFPEELWPPTVEPHAYEARVARGRETMRHKRVVICGLARDIAPFLPNTIRRIEQLGELFADYRVVVYENDSLDDTREILLKWAKRCPRVHVLSDRLQAPVNRQIRCPLRGTRMALYRNKYRDFVARHFADFDTCIVADMDLPGGWSYDGISNSFGWDDWDVVGSYGVIFQRIRYRLNVPVHFDAWAYREQGSFAPMPTGVVNRYYWQRGESLVPVYSCFGGLAVYRMDALLSARYEGGDCEHVPLHRKMQEQGFSRIYLNPSQLVHYGRKHKRWDSLLTACQRAAAFCCGDRIPYLRALFGMSPAPPIRPRVKKLAFHPSPSE